MLMKSSRWLVTGASLALVAFAVTAAPAQRDLTVGDFAVKLTRALGYSDMTPDQAGASLRQAGVHLDADLSAPLTEGRAIDIVRELGVPVQPSASPDAPLSSSLAESAATAVALSASAAPEKFSAESLPTACLGLSDRSSCRQCCLGILLPTSKSPLKVALICTVICDRIFPPPSGSTPGQ